MSPKKSKSKKSIYTLLGLPPSPSPSDPFDPEHTYTTSFCIPTLALALLRLLFAFYAFVTLFFQLIYESTAIVSPAFPTTVAAAGLEQSELRWSAKHHLSYFTNLCYWGLAAYLAVSGVHSLARGVVEREEEGGAGGGGGQRWRRPPAGAGWRDMSYTIANAGVEIREGEGGEEEKGAGVGVGGAGGGGKRGRGRGNTFWRRLDLNEWPRPLQAAHAVLYSSIMVFPPLVTIVFWSVLYKNPWWSDVFDGWKNVNLNPPPPPRGRNILPLRPHADN